MTRSVWDPPSLAFHLTAGSLTHRQSCDQSFHRFLLSWVPRLGSVCGGALVAFAQAAHALVPPHRLYGNHCEPGLVEE